MREAHGHNVMAAKKLQRTSNQAPATEFNFARDIERGAHHCRHCDKMFVAPEARDRHEREHNNVRKFTCHKCGQGFTKVVNKRKHEGRCQTTSSANEER